MRMPRENEDLTGKICVCSTGRIGIVAYYEITPNIGWYGVGFDGKGTWFSSNPCICYESLKEYRKVLTDRFNGKMSHLG